jgi:rhodanese-related sulfurtransferase
MEYPFPLQILQTVSAANPWTYLVFAVIGFGFGYVLEISGFGNSKKLAAQFYFRELTVLKVMFGAIVTAMVLIFTMIGLGIVDYSLIWVNPTYLWSGIVGGLIMGVGFIVGGFCPGTSLVSAFTGKIDGIFFVLGVTAGIFAFGETEWLYDYWWQTSGSLGRLTIMDWLNLPNGVVVTIIVAMALFMFWGSEQLERIFGKRDLAKEPKLRVYGAVALFAVAFGTILIGSPGIDQKLERTTFTREIGVEGASLKLSANELLNQRLAQVSPAEMYHTMFDNGLVTVLLDVRPEADYNIYHLSNALNVPLVQISSIVPQLQAKHSPNTIYFVMSNDEETATQAWKTLVGNGVKNVYILEGGLNNWIAFFGADDPEIKPLTEISTPEQLRYNFPAVLGSRYKSCYPDPQKWEELEYEPVIKLELQRDKSGGGCG